MFSKNIITKFIKIGIKTWLKSVCKSIDIHYLKIILNEKYLSKLDKIYFEAKNIIYQDLYIYDIKIKIYECNLIFNYKDHLIYSEDLIINCFLTIDSRSLENTFFSNKWQIFRKKIEKELLGEGKVTHLVINNGFITFRYNINNSFKHKNLLLVLKEKLIFIEDINNKKKIFLPLDKNIKINCCNIKNELINLNFSSKVIFNN